MSHIITTTPTTITADFADGRIVLFIKLFQKRIICKRTLKCVFVCSVCEQADTITFCSDSPMLFLYRTFSADIITTCTIRIIVIIINPINLAAAVTVYIQVYLTVPVLALILYIIFYYRILLAFQNAFRHSTKFFVLCISHW